MNTFYKDLSTGAKIEAIVLEELQKEYPSATLIDGKHSAYDIWIPEIHKSVEVKYDSLSSQTGRFVIEIMMFKRYSGLLVSKADYWCIHDGFRGYWIKREDLLKVIIISNQNWIEKKFLGDTVSKKVYFLEKKNFMHLFKENLY